MKRAGNLYPKIAELENLQLAFWKAQRHKRDNGEVASFRHRLDENLAGMRDALLAGNIEMGNYHYFTIYDPKERIICAAPFIERVLQHAIMNICEPYFEKYQIFDSYACRKDKGTYAAVDRAKQYSRKYSWHLKLDVKKYFYNIDHEVLFKLLCQRFKDAKLLNLFSELIATYEIQPGKGIPIGNLTSQYFANHYLAVMDHFIKKELRAPGYVRYMDDFVLWDNSREKLKQWNKQITDFVAEVSRLQLKPCVLNNIRHGLSFLGYRIFNNKILLDQRSRQRFAVKFAYYNKMLTEGEWSQQQFSAHILPLLAFVKHAAAKGFCVKIEGNCSKALTA